MSARARRNHRPWLAILTASAVMTAAFIGTGAATAAPSGGPDSVTDGPHAPAGTDDLTTNSTNTTSSSSSTTAGTVRPSGIPDTGQYAFLLELDTPSTGKAFAGSRRTGSASDARSAAREQLARVTAAQDAVVAGLPDSTPVLYRTHSLLSAVAVTTDVANYGRLTGLAGVSEVFPIAPKSFENSTADQLQGAPRAWEGSGAFGQDTSVAIIDTGLDYTHANFGGPGTVAAYTAARRTETAVADPALFPNEKVVGGYDLVGDSYQPDPGSSGYQPVPHGDPNPLDCNGHGSHVGGSVAGYGENADGTTYEGDYDEATPFDTMKIGPGMAPRAELYGFRVFGCSGSTNVVTQALDMATDPDGDGDPSDAVDVINMSLGSDFGSPRDADSRAANLAVEAGINVVISSGNSYDLYDVGGAPGAATKALTVAASSDSTSIIDGLQVDLAGTTGLHGVSRSIAYDWSTKPDLVGDVVLAPAGNTTACTAYTSEDAAVVAGRIALVTWTQEDLECGSAVRGANLRAAGAAGFIFANSAEVITAGITGDSVIPGVLVVKSGADAIRDALDAGTPVTAAGLVSNAVTQVFPEDTDKVADFSSRGMRAKGNVKPDVTAVGASVFSTAVGTGDGGLSESGTSMAAPMVAGLAALVVSAHDDWDPEQVKANIMNTAGADLHTGGADAPTSARYAPNRVGSGRIDAEDAVANDVLAYVADDAGAVSVSFGPVEVTAPTTATKTVTVDNTGAAAATYTTGYDAITTVPGVTYVIAPGSLTVPAGGTASVTVTFTVTDPTELTHTVDATHGRENLQGVPLDTIADASGNLLLTPADVTAPQLRVPVYSAPRPASTMTQAGSLVLPVGSDEGSLTLTGTGVDNGEGAEQVTSLVAGLELQAVSPVLPSCVDGALDLCVGSPDDSSADLRNIGVTSDYPLTGDVATSMVYIGINTYAPYSTPGTKLELDVYIDVDANNSPDVMAVTTRVPQEDQFVVDLYDLGSGQLLSTQPLNGRQGDVDTAKLDSDTMLVPVSVQSLVDAGLSEENPTIRFGVVSFASSSIGVVDAAGISILTGGLATPMRANVFEPGISVTDAEGSGPLVVDEDGAELTVTRHPTSYKANRGLGLMMVHLHNEVGSKTQVVSLQSTPAVTMQANPVSVLRGTSTLLTVGVTDPTGYSLPSGVVEVVDAATGAKVAGGTVVGGKASMTYRPTSGGTVSLEARYAGDATYAPTVSGPVGVVVSSSMSGVALQVTRGTVVRGASAGLRVVVTDPTMLAVPTGSVQVVDTSTGTPVATGTLTEGQVSLTYTSSTPGARTLRAVYLGSASLDSTTSSVVQLDVTRAEAAVTVKVAKKKAAKKGPRGTAVRTVVAVPTVLGVPATGKVVLRVDGKRVGAATLRNGRASVTWTPRRKGTFTVSATYAGDATYTSDVSRKVRYRAF